MKTIVFKLIAVTAAFIFMAGCADDSIQGDKVNLDGLAKTLSIKGQDYIATNNNKKHDFTATSTGAVTRGMTPEGIFTVTEVVPLNRDDLEGLKTVVKIYYGSENVGLAVPGFGGITLGKDEASLNMYFLETRVVTNEADTVVYGIGYSIHYLFQKIKKGINITNLPTVAASAQLENKKTQVCYSMQTYGITGTNLIKYFKPNVNKNFDVEGFGVMQSSIDGIHNILSDETLSKSVKFTPGVLPFITPYDLN